MERGHFLQNHRASKGTKRDDITYQSLKTKELALPPYLFTPNNKLNIYRCECFQPVKQGHS